MIAGLGGNIYNREQWQDAGGMPRPIVAGGIYLPRARSRDFPDRGTAARIERGDQPQLVAVHPHPGRRALTMERAQRVLGTEGALSRTTLGTGLDLTDARGRGSTCCPQRCARSGA